MTVKEDIENYGKVDVIYTWMSPRNSLINVSPTYKDYLLVYNIFLILLNNIISDLIRIEFIDSWWFNLLITDVYKNNILILNISKIKNKVKLFNEYMKYFSDEIYRKFLRHAGSLMIQKLEEINQKKLK